MEMAVIYRENSRLSWLDNNLDEIGGGKGLRNFTSNAFFISFDFRPSIGNGVGWIGGNSLAIYESTPG